jgi:VCBS repeat-containing protein
VAEDAVLSVIPANGVLSNDTDTDHDAITASALTGPAHGALTLNPDGSFTYTPEANYSGADSFTYRAFDGAAYSDPATVSITVNSVNDAPNKIMEIPAQIVKEDFSGMVINLADYFADTEDSPAQLTYQVFETTTDRVFKVATAGLSEGTSLAFVLTPNAFGESQITIRATDSGGLWVEDTFALTVTPVNDAPIAGNDVYAIGNNGVLTVSAPGVLATDSDVDGDTLTASVVTGPSHGVLSLNPDGSFNYTPDSHYTGEDVFTYVANDGALDSPAATVTITVTEANDPPTLKAAFPDALVDEDSIIGIDLSQYFSDDKDHINDLAFSVVETSAGQTLIGLVDRIEGNLLVLRLSPNTFGTGDITIRAVDTGGLWVEDTFTLTVTPVNDAPAVTVVACGTCDEDPGGPVNLGHVFRVSDPDNDVLTVTVAATGNGQSMGVYTFTGAPNDVNERLTTLQQNLPADWNGVIAYTLTVTDGHSDPVQAASTLTVNPVNDPPEISIGTIPAATAGSTVNLGNVFSVRDVDGDTLTFTIVARDSNGNYVDRLEMTDTPGVTLTRDTDHPNAIVTVTGSPDALNIALSTLTESLPSTFTGSLYLTPTVSDGIAPVVTSEAPASIVVGPPPTPEPVPTPQPTAETVTTTTTPVQTQANTGVSTYTTLSDSGPTGVSSTADAAGGPTPTMSSTTTSSPTSALGTTTSTSSLAATVASEPSTLGSSLSIVDAYSSGNTFSSTLTTSTSSATTTSTSTSTTTSTTTSETVQEAAKPAEASVPVTVKETESSTTKKESTDSGAQKTGAEAGQTGEKTQTTDGKQATTDKGSQQPQGEKAPKTQEVAVKTGEGAKEGTQQPGPTTGAKTAAGVAEPATQTGKTAAPAGATGEGAKPVAATPAGHAAFLAPPKIMVLDPAGIKALDLFKGTTYNVELTDTPSATIGKLDQYLGSGVAPTTSQTASQYTVVSDKVEQKLWQDVSKCVSRCTQCDALNQQRNEVFW